MDEQAPLTFRFGTHQSVPAQPGDSVALALLRAGIVATGRSVKYRRPRGPFCLTGDCGTCLVRVDGQPNMRSCLVRVRTGLHVEPQNVVGTEGIDPTGVVDHALPMGMDHHHFMVKPRVVNRVMMEVARELAGLGTLPAARTDLPHYRHHHHTPQVLVVGYGPAGRAAHHTLVAAGIRVLAVDRYAPDTLADRLGEPVPPDVLGSTAVFGVYPVEGVWAAVQEQPEPVIHTIRASNVVVATGSRDVMPPWPDNDLPGIVAAPGLAHQLARREQAVPLECVVIGHGDRGRHWARELGAPLVDDRLVERFFGSHQVEGVLLRDGQRVSCRLAAMAREPAPAYELARQAGAKVVWTGHGFAVLSDERGRCRSDANGTVWACGDVCGAANAAAAKQDGERVAYNLLANLGVTAHA